MTTVWQKKIKLWQKFTIRLGSKRVNDGVYPFVAQLGFDFFLLETSNWQMMVHCKRVNNGVYPFVTQLGFEFSLQETSNRRLMAFTKVNFGSWKWKWEKLNKCLLETLLLGLRHRLYRGQNGCSMGPNKMIRLKEFATNILFHVSYCIWKLRWVNSKRCSDETPTTWAGRA